MVVSVAYINKAKHFFFLLLKCLYCIASMFGCDCMVLCGKGDVSFYIYILLCVFILLPCSKFMNKLCDLTIYESVLRNKRLDLELIFT